MSDIINRTDGVCRPDVAEMFLVPGSTKMPRLTALWVAKMRWTGFPVPHTVAAMKKASHKPIWLIKY